MKKILYCSLALIYIPLLIDGKRVAAETIFVESVDSTNVDIRCQNAKNRAAKAIAEELIRQESKQLFELGLQYEKMPKPNFEYAYRYYSKAAELGHADAQINLAWMYELGKNVKHDRKQAIAWLQCAANTGNHQASEDLKFLTNRQHSEDMRRRVNQTFKALVKAFQQQRSK